MHKEIAHDLGPKSDKVAQGTRVAGTAPDIDVLADFFHSHHLASPDHADIGQSGANLAAAGGDVALSTTSYVHGFNAATGAGQGLAGQK